MMTYEERKAQLLKNTPFETIQRETRTALETLEKHADPTVTVDDLYRALHKLYWPLGYPYVTVKGLIDYFWSDKIHKASKMFEKARANQGSTGE